MHEISKIKRWNIYKTYGVDNRTLNKENFMYIGWMAKLEIVSTDSIYNNSNVERYTVNPVSIIITGGKITSGVYGTGTVEGASVKENVNIEIYPEKN